MKRLTFTVLALQDLKEIHAYIAQDNADIALDFIERLQNRGRSLSEMPGAGSQRYNLKPNMRSAAEGNYTIFYRPLLNGIEVVRVVHSKRDLSKIKFSESM